MAPKSLSLVVLCVSLRLGTGCIGDQTHTDVDSTHVTLDASNPECPAAPDTYEVGHTAYVTIEAPIHTRGTCTCDETQSPYFGFGEVCESAADMGAPVTMTCDTEDETATAEALVIEATNPLATADAAPMGCQISPSSTSSPTFPLVVAVTCAVPYDVITLHVEVRTADGVAEASCELGFVEGPPCLPDDAGVGPFSDGGAAQESDGPTDAAERSDSD